MSEPRRVDQQGQTYDPLIFAISVLSMRSDPRYVSGLPSIKGRATSSVYVPERTGGVEKCIAAQLCAFQITKTY